MHHIYWLVNILPLCFSSPFFALSFSTASSISLSHPHPLQPHIHMCTYVCVYFLMKHLGLAVSLNSRTFLSHNTFITLGKLNIYVILFHIGPIVSFPNHPHNVLYKFIKSQKSTVDALMEISVGAMKMGGGGCRFSLGSRSCQKRLHRGGFLGAEELHIVGTGQGRGPQGGAGVNVCVGGGGCEGGLQARLRGTGRLEGAGARCAFISCRHPSKEDLAVVWRSRCRWAGPKASRPVREFRLHFSRGLCCACPPFFSSNCTPGFQLAFTFCVILH